VPQPPSPGADWPNGVNISCRVFASDKPVPISTYAEAWDPANKYSFCDARVSRIMGGEFTAAEQQGIDLAYNGTRTSVNHLYTRCANVELGINPREPMLSEHDSRSVQAALLVCPDHRYRAEGLAAAGVADEAYAARSEGREIGAGIKQVGVDVQPGQYVADSPSQGCYWEALDSAGNIIDNNYTQQSLRQEVWISPDWFSFNSSRCGWWRLQ
jgi:hypothetical protein